MVKDSLDALVRLDAHVARNVCRDDQAVDELHKKIFADLQVSMQESPDNIPGAVATISVSRNLERIADLATNIAEDVVFMVEGEVIRHSRGEDKVIPLPRQATE